MLRYVARRLVIMFVTLFVIITVTFFISKALPGTPFADDKLTPSPGRYSSPNTAWISP